MLNPEQVAAEWLMKMRLGSHPRRDELAKSLAELVELERGEEYKRGYDDGAEAARMINDW